MAIAYQVVGDGPVDLVFVPFFGNVRYTWEQPLYAHFFERLASFSRLILRGVTRPPDLKRPLFRRTRRE